MKLRPNVVVDRLLVHEHALPESRKYETGVSE